MKKSFAIFFALLLVVGVASAAPLKTADPCQLIISIKPILDMLKTLAFLGAAFVIAGWAWGFISKGEVKTDDVQNKGIGLIVGFTLLFGIGMILQFLPGFVGCAGAL